MKVITYEALALYAPDSVQVMVTRQVGSRHLGAMGARGFIVDGGEVYEISHQQLAYPDENHYKATWRHILETPPSGVTLCDPEMAQAVLDWLRASE